MQSGNGLIPADNMLVTQNDDIATRLEEAAQLLGDQHANGYRIRADQRAAQTIRTLGQPVTDLVETGGEALAELSGIAALHEMFRAGQTGYLIVRLHSFSSEIRK